MFCSPNVNNVKPLKTSCVNRIHVCSRESSSREVFMKSIKSRLVVQQVVNTVTANAQFTFDYLLLIILASLISCMGLVESSSVVLVASMLISPLMGPILATTFGQVIQNHGLRNLGLKSELSGLLICIFVGFVFGLVTGSFGLKGAVWGSTDQWPTQEMASRGELRALWVGMLIAVPSGAGVALSVLGGNAGSLVGVAISASLLPPACNAGMLWAYSFLAAISPPEIVQTATTLLTTAMPLTTAMIDNITITIATNTTISTTAPTATNPTHLASEGTCLALVNNAYVPVYSCSVPREAAMLGAISLLLTILNILCIIAMGVLVLRIKEVAPETAGPIKSFFSEDIHVARSYNTTQKGVTGNTLGKQLLSEWSLYKEQQAQSDQDGLSKEIGVVEFVNQIKDIEMSPYTQHLLSNLPNRSSWAVHNELSPEYDMAVNRLNEQLSKHPSVYLADASVTDQRIKQAYNTIHHIPGQQNSMGAEFRRHLKQRSSARNMRPVSTVLETVSETSLNSNKNEQPSVAPTAASGRNLLNFTSNKLFKRRKPRVQFKEGESDSLV
ncbi:Y678-like protein [Mya arenaria]|uniref:Y678-like protein n=1 Tax=Mya arenaria TaxID=6604 RepID=A0ABY7FPD6_MYAAR|nr:Y678-like protein [Mya arenaria]